MTGPVAVVGAVLEHEQRRQDRRTGTETRHVAKTDEQLTERIGRVSTTVLPN